MFTDEILKVIGEKEVSSTQRYRVLLIKDGTDKCMKVSFQKWWRPDTTKDWQVGKGFKLDKEECLTLGNFLLQAESELV